MRWLPLLLVACVHVQRVPPKARDWRAQYAAAVSVESVCVSGDPFHDGGTIKVHAHAGSGVIVHVLTALHVVECPYIANVVVVQADGKRLRMMVERERRDLDVARLVLASADSFAVLPPVIAAPHISDAMCSAAVEPAREWSCGAVESLDAVPGDIRTTGRTVRGNSGSGLYNSDGALVDIVVAKPRDSDGTYATSLWMHREVLP